jgi:hypothetical protein
MLPDSFYEVSITLIPKTDKYIARKKNYGTIFLMNIVYKSWTKLNLTMYKKLKSKLSDNLQNTQTVLLIIVKVFKI